MFRDGLIEIVILLALAGPTVGVYFGLMSLGSSGDIAYLLVGMAVTGLSLLIGIMAWKLAWQVNLYSWVALFFGWAFSGCPLHEWPSSGGRLEPD